MFPVCGRRLRALSHVRALRQRLDSRRMISPSVPVTRHLFERDAFGRSVNHIDCIVLRMKPLGMIRKDNGHERTRGTDQSVSARVPTAVQRPR